MSRLQINVEVSQRVITGIKNFARYERRSVEDQTAIMLEWIVPKWNRLVINKEYTELNAELVSALDEVKRIAEATEANRLAMEKAKAEAEATAANLKVSVDKVNDLIHQVLNIPEELASAEAREVKRAIFRANSSTGVKRG